MAEMPEEWLTLALGWTGSISCCRQLYLLPLDSLRYFLLLHLKILSHPIPPLQLPSPFHSLFLQVPRLFLNSSTRLPVDTPPYRARCILRIPRFAFEKQGILPLPPRPLNSRDSPSTCLFTHVRSVIAAETYTPKLWSNRLSADSTA